jgi:exopolysaccharide production protein ExoQ
VNVILALGWAPPHAHNGFIEAWLDLGGVGLAMLLALWGFALYDIAKCLRPNRAPQVDWYIAILAVLFMFNFVEPLLVEDRQLAWVLFIVACVGLRLEARSLKHPEGAAA